MKRLVLKFGGTSVGSITKIKNVANIVNEKRKEGNEIIVVVSAMAGVTNELMKKSQEVSENFSLEELDVLLSSGEQASSALLAGAVIDLGINARSWMGWQIPIITDSNYSSSQIKSIIVDEIEKFISGGGIAIIAGFQGVSSEKRQTCMRTQPDPNQ